MKKLGFYSLLPLIIFALASPGAAEFYRYKDEHGNTLFTDDLSKVPVDQRARAAIYEESSGDQPATNADSGAKNENSPQQPADTVETLKMEGQRLLKVKEELDKNYKALADENARLKAEQEAAVTPDQIKAVNKKVVTYNAQYQAYQEKSAAYEAEVKAYNERLSKVETKPKSDSGNN